MAFTFQINRDVKFNHNEALLKKAEENHPEIFRTKAAPKRIVEIIPDETKLNGWGVKKAALSLENLSSFGMKRDDSLILDFGEHCVGSFSVNISSVGSPMDAPLYMRVRFGEIPAELAGDSSSYEGWLSKSWIQEEYIHLDELPAKLSLPRRYSFRYVEIKVLDTSPKWQAVFENPEVVKETSADYRNLKEIFVEEELKKIYDVSVKTLAECMQDVFEDGPKRDRRLWIGDLRLQALANYVTFDNVELVKRCLYLFGAMNTAEGKIPANVFVKPASLPDDTFLFDYSLFFISVLYDYETAHPDIEFLKELFPVAKAQMDLSLSMVNEKGKLACKEEYPVFIDWSNDFNKDTAGQAVMIYVLKQFIALSKIMGEETEAYEDVLEKMVSYAKKILFSPEKGMFLSGEEQECNLASQVWMVLAHVMSEEENKAIMTRAVKELFPVKGIATPYMYHHVTEALFEAGLKEEGIRLLKSYWGEMLRLGADTFWEAFEPENPNYSPYGNPIVSSYCHAWSCTPVYLIHKYLL